MKFKNMLKGAAVATAVTAGLAVSGAPAHAEGLMQEILERGQVRIGVQGAFMPLSFPDTAGNLQGIEVDLAKSVAEALGVDLELVIITTSNRMQFLQQGKIDMIIGGMFDTAERRKIIGMVEPAYWTSGPTLLAKKGAIESWDDIAGKPVCSKQGNLYNKQLEVEFKAQVVAFTGNAEGKQALRSGSCVAVVTDDILIAADLALPEWADYEAPVDVLYNNPWAAAVPIEESDKAWGVFASGMAYRWQASGKLLELAEKWKVQPSAWFTAQHEKHQWNTDYLEPQE